MIQIKSFGKNKKNNGGGGGSTTIINNGGFSETHTLWGNDFNGKQDVDGDIKVREGGSIEATNGKFDHIMSKNSNPIIYADSNLYPETDSVHNLGSSNYKWNAVYANSVITQNMTLNNNLRVKGKLNVDGDSTLLNVNTSNINNTGDITTNNVTVNNDGRVNGTMTVNNLKVIGIADFSTLTKDEVSSVGGAMIVSAANGEVEKRAIKSGKEVNTHKIPYEYIKNVQEVKKMQDDGDVEWDFTVEHDSYYEWVLYFQGDNKFKEGDYVLCKSFGEDNAKYYWTIVTEVSETKVTKSTEDVKPYTFYDELDENTEYNYICIANDLGVKDLNDEFHYFGYDLVADVEEDNTLNGISKVDVEVGDILVQLGHCDESDEIEGENKDNSNRQGALIISSTTDEIFDATNRLKAPFIAQYIGINDFDLSTHRGTYFDNNSAYFNGTIRVTDTIQPLTIIEATQNFEWETHGSQSVLVYNVPKYGDGLISASYWVDKTSVARNTMVTAWIVLPYPDVYDLGRCIEIKAPNFKEYSWGGAKHFLQLGVTTKAKNGDWIDYTTIALNNVDNALCTQFGYSTDYASAILGSNKLVTNNDDSSVSTLKVVCTKVNRGYGDVYKWVIIDTQNVRLLGTNQINIDNV